jgi:hypothetical protein
MKSREISKSAKLKIYRTVIMAVVMLAVRDVQTWRRLRKKDLKQGIRPEKGHKWMENSYKQGRYI